MAQFIFLFTPVYGLNLYFNRGVSHIQLENYKEAVNDFSRSIELSYQPELSAFQRGLSYYMLEQYEESISDLELYVDAYPDNSDSWIYLALSYFNTKNYNDAITYFEKCINAGIMLGECHYHLASIYLDKKQFKKAITHYTSSADLNYLKDYSLFNRGVAYLNLNKVDEAKKDFQKVVNITQDTNLKKSAKDAIDKLS